MKMMNADWFYGLLLVGKMADQSGWSVMSSQVFPHHFVMYIYIYIYIYIYKLNSVALIRTRTIQTERPPLVGEVSANFCG